MNIYHDVQPITKDAAQKMFLSNKVENICNALVSIAFYDPDWKWVQDKCLHFFLSNDPNISGLAATCLGHIARIHHKLDKEKVINLLNSRRNDAEIGGQIEDALDDIDSFII